MKTVAETARRNHNLVRGSDRTVAIEDHTNDLTRILLVEDHASFRQALAFMFEREPGFEVVAQAGSLAEARTLPGEALKDVEVAVIDLALPDGDGFELIEYFSSAEPKIMTLILSASLELGRFARAVEAGAAGVLHKATPIKDIVAAVRQLKSGEALLSPDEVVEILRVVSRERQQKQEALQAIEKLTPRELELLQALAEGLESREIAQKLNITVETERTHMVNILHKLGVHSRLQALVFAVRHGLVRIN
jgi:two-component system nitrate/nitrite response regulator NarL